MKCTNPNCGGEWTPPPGKSVTVCPFCQEPIASEKKTTKSLDNVVDTLVYIKEQHGVDTLLGEKVYTYFSDLTRNQFRDETDLIKQLCEKGALDCLKTAIGKPDSEHEVAIKRAHSKLPKYLQDSPAVAEMLHDFAVALGWKITKPQQSVSVPQPVVQQSQIIHPRTIVQTNTNVVNRVLSVMPSVGSIHNFAGIDWRVLAVENNKAMLISEEVIEERPYSVEYKEITWEHSSIRKYLNVDFYNKLGSAKFAIAEICNSNPANPWCDTKGGNQTIDKIFLLSIDEIITYYGDSGQLKSRNPMSKTWINDRYNSKRIAISKKGKKSMWWLRSPGYSSRHAAIVSKDGCICFVYSIGLSERNRVSVTCGVRPALWLNL